MGTRADRRAARLKQESEVKQVFIDALDSTLLLHREIWGSLESHLKLNEYYVLGLRTLPWFNAKNAGHQVMARRISHEVIGEIVKTAKELPWERKEE